MQHHYLLVPANRQHEKRALEAGIPATQWDGNPCAPWRQEGVYSGRRPESQESDAGGTSKKRVCRDICLVFDCMPMMDDAGEQMCCVRNDFES